MSIDPKALFNLGYGLYVVTCNDGNKNNGLIVNTVMQVADNPLKVIVSINKQNYSHDVIKQTKKMNVNSLTTSAPLSLFKHYGFQSGRNVNKFDNYCVVSENGIVYLGKHINGFISLNVDEYIDMESHGLFICSVTESKVFNNDPSMTYAYYHQNVKAKPIVKAKGYVCTICGYVHEEDELPEDFVCPLCLHDASYFEKL